MENTQNQLLIYKNEAGAIEVQLSEGTVWLSLQQCRSFWPWQMLFTVI